VEKPASGLMPCAPALAAFQRRIRLPDQSEAFVYDSGGDGSALILLHGLQDEADTWRRVFGALAKRHRVIAPDLPGFGRSDKRPRSFGVPLYAGWVMALAASLEVGRFGLIGNSLGAIVADAIAVQHPDRVTALVLLDGSLVITKPPVSRLSLLQRLFLDHYDGKYFASLRAGSAEAAYDTLRPYYSDLDSLPREDRDFLAARVVARVWDEPQRLAALRIQKSSLPYFLTAGRRLAARIPSLNVPTLVVWGGDDAIFPLANAQPRADAQPGARVEILPGVGHLPQQELPELLLKQLAPFLAASIGPTAVPRP
jgi:pimeloyl-ACP methyl ester carboxylesterase